MTALLIRANRNEVDAAALAQLGIDSVIDPYLSIAAHDNPAGVHRLVAALGDGTPSWLIATSTNALPFLEDALDDSVSLDRLIAAHPQLSFAAIGAATAAQLRVLGADQVLTPAGSDSASLADLLTQELPGRAIIPAGSIAMESLSTRLREAGWEVVSEVVYATETVAHTPSSVARVHSGEICAVVLRSPSAARAFVHHAGRPDVPVVCAGRTTAAQASALGLTVTVVAPSPEPEAVAQAVASALSSHTERRDS